MKGIFPIIYPFIIKKQYFERWNSNAYEFVLKTNGNIIFIWWEREEELVLDTNLIASGVETIEQAKKIISDRLKNNNYERIIPKT